MKLIGSILFASFVLTGCGSVSTEAASHLNGFWTREQNVTGSSLLMSLTVHDTTVTGTGNYSIEAGRSGTLVVKGLYAAGVVKLDLTFDYDTTSATHFEGTFTSVNRIAGNITYVASNGQRSTSPVTFGRIAVDPPG